MVRTAGERVADEPEPACGRSGPGVGPRPLLRLTLVRHGRPDVADPWMPAARFDGFWRDYDAAGIRGDSAPSPALRAALSDCDLLVTSTLRRARESLARVAPGAEARVDARFCEIGIPSVPLPGLRLPASAWSAVGRVAWLSRLVPGEESVGGAGRRVREAARALSAWSEQHAHIGVVTHGFFNGWLGAELRRLGWQGARLGTPWHWSFQTFTREGRPHTAAASAP